MLMYCIAGFSLFLLFLFPECGLLILTFYLFIPYGSVAIHTKKPSNYRFLYNCRNLSNVKIRAVNRFTI